MKKFFSISLILIAFVFTGCYEMTEEYTIKPDNTGVYEMKMDMGKLFAFVESMGGADAMKDDPDIQKMADTTILFKDFVDTSTALTADQKEWMRNGSMSFKVKVDEKLFKISTNFPFKSLAQLDKNLKSDNGGMESIFDKLMGKSGEAEAEETEEEDATKKQSQEMMNKFKNIYTTDFKDGFISRKADGEKLTAIKDDPATAQLSAMIPMMGDMEFNTIIHLPRPAKKTTGNGVQLSADKKTLTIKYAFTKLIEDSSVGAFSVEY